MRKMRFIPILVLILAGSVLPWSTVHSQDIVQRNLLKHFSREELKSSLLGYNQWSPFPKSAAKWREKLPDSIRTRIIAEGERFLHEPFASLPATLYLEFERDGNRVNYETVSFKKRSQLFGLVLAESVEQKGRFSDAIANGVWSFCEESFWGVPAHYYLQKAGIGLPDVQDPSVDIFSSETAEILALTDYLVGPELDSVSPLLRKRIYYEVDRRVLIPLEKDSIAYSYLGSGKRDAPVNNWNPWVISNWMISLLLLEKDDHRRVKELYHAMGLLDNYINGLGEDGAVDEGPSYWFGGAGRLFDALEMLRSATAGKITVYDAPVIRLLGGYIEKMHIAGNYFIDIADASPTISADGLLIYRVGLAVKDTGLIRFGAWAYHHLDDHDFYHKDFSKPRILWNFLTLKDCESIDPPEPSSQETWFRNLQLMAAASGKGLFVASHGGHNGESHNHNDVGDFMVYNEGQPVIIDVGFGTYTAKTFSKDRYSLWYLSSAYHNLPVINGVQQAAGRKYEARDVSQSSDAAKTELQMDIAAAYPESAGAVSWKRNITLDKSNNEVRVKDVFRLNKWTQPLTQTFMTICPTEEKKPGQIRFQLAGKGFVVLEYDSRVWELKKELMDTSGPDERRIADNWGHRPIWRLLLVNKTHDKNGVFKYRFVNAR